MNYSMTDGSKLWSSTELVTAVTTSESTRFPCVALDKKHAV